MCWWWAWLEMKVKLHQTWSCILLLIHKLHMIVVYNVLRFCITCFRSVSWFMLILVNTTCCEDFSLLSSHSVYKKKVYVIDVGQSVDELHPSWRVFLKRDIHNILTFFSHHTNISRIDEAENDLYIAITNETISPITFIKGYINLCVSWKLSFCINNSILRYLMLSIQCYHHSL